jgi:hypothetical protein
MHFTYFMGQASVEENSLSRCGFSSIDVGNNTDVSVSLNGSRSWHFEILRWLTGSTEPIMLIELDLAPKTCPEINILKQLARIGCQKNLSSRNLSSKNLGA